VNVNLFTAETHVVKTKPRGSRASQATWTFITGLSNEEHSMNMVEPGATKGREQQHAIRRELPRVGNN
jgi:hypothetical protein